MFLHDHITVGGIDCFMCGPAANFKPQKDVDPSVWSGLAMDCLTQQAGCFNLWLGNAGGWVHGAGGQGHSVGSFRHTHMVLLMPRICFVRTDFVPVIRL